MNLAIIGGGNLAHAVAASASLFFKKTSVLTTSCKDWNSNLTVIFPGNEVIVSSKIVCSDNPEKILKDADIVLLTVPSHIIPSKLIEIKPFLKKDSIIGSVIASGGFFWISRNILGADQPLFAFQRVPFICRIIEKGKSVSVTGTKSELFAAFHFSNGFPENYSNIKDLFEKSFRSRIIQLNSYLEVTISNSNPILHTSRLSTLVKDGSIKEPLYFYRTWDDLTSEILLKCDEEIIEIINKISVPFPLFKSLKEHYCVADHFELTKKLSSIEAFRNITFPVVKEDSGILIPDPDNRYFQEDLAFGLVILKALAEIFGVKTHNIDSVIRTLQEFLSKNYISENGTLNGNDVRFSGIPQNYGFSSVKQLMTLNNKN
ncbi:NAD/NADP octopine/nopaline dehydrogenase family protein [bacterium]|nr:NAD/NADP octopine/nopaline dehydrogenase family protein [bacterium]